MFQPSVLERLVGEGMVGREGECRNEIMNAAKRRRKEGNYWRVNHHSLIPSDSASPARPISQTKRYRMK